ncbi:MAG TPA: radical SAM protein [Oscillospiraceae bacterium]|nr:radical SAM protein [Oscillospiraceae bacterium]HPS33925.1 radical SAM protein [Oscillospiraceae bacterium]
MHFKKYKSILSPHNGMNIYRGCQHGCIYCDSRSLCYQFTHDFEDIEVKTGAPEQLESELLRKRSRSMVGTGSMCDPYIPLEKELEYTRRCLEVIDRLGFGLAILTKSDLILRDLDLLKSINEKAKCVVEITLTTFDQNLCKILEPNVCTTKRRFEVLKILRDYGIPTVVWLCPLLPFINDTEENLRGILSYCFEAKVKGIICFDIGVTLRDGDREYFFAALNRHFPGIMQKYIQKFGLAYSCVSDNSPALMKIFHHECEKRGIMHDVGQIFKYMNTLEENDEQLTLI